MLVERAAKAAHEANRVLCIALADYSQPRWEDAPDWQAKSAMAGVEAILANRLMTPEESHASWMAMKAADGWKYGPTKAPELKEHPCMVPYGELPEEQRLKDEMFGIVVRSVLGIPLLGAPNPPEPVAVAVADVVSGLPSAEDLDAVAEEAAIAEAGYGEDAPPLEESGPEEVEEAAS